MADIDDKDGIIGSFKQTIKELGDAFYTNLDPTNIKDILHQVDTAASQVMTTMGVSNQNLIAIKASMGDAATSVASLGGQFSDIVDIQTKAATTLGRNLILTSESYSKLYAAQKVSGQSIESITTGFKDAGFSMYDASSQMEKVVLKANSLGVNSLTVSKQVVENMSSLNKFNFANGVEGLAKMAAQATSLRIDMSSTLSIADGLFDPEKAISMAASMQRLGVAQSDLLDPLRLMDLAQNDPAELQNQIAKMSEQFVRLNKDGNFEIMPGAKRQMKEIESAMGLPAGQLAKMALGSAELAEKMKAIKFPGGDITEDQRTMIANMAEMNKGTGKYEVSFTGEKGEKVTKSVAELSKPDIEALSKQPKTLEDVAKSQLTQQESMAASLATIRDRFGMAVAGTKVGQAALDAPRELYKQLEKTLSAESTSIKTMRQGIDKNVGGILEDFNKFIKGESSLSKVLESLQSASKNIQQGTKTAFTDTVDKAEESMKNLTTSQNIFIELMVNSGERLKKVIESIPQVKEVIGNQSSNVPTTNTLRNVSSTTPGGMTEMNTKHTVDSNVNLNIKIDSNNPNIDTAQLSLALKDPQMIQAIYSIGKLDPNNNLTTNKTGSRTKQMLEGSYA
jgi:hypothetical protein